MKKRFILAAIPIYLVVAETVFITGCKRDPELPTVTTATVTDITLNSARSGGNVTSDGGAEVTSRGVCWGLSTNPAASQNHTNDSKGPGAFTSVIETLMPNTVYYVRAYATNKVGTSYGEERSFRTNPIVIATLTTAAVTSVTSTTAASGGNISADGGGAISARGVCWNTSPNPTTANSKTSDGTGTGNFSSNLTDLTPGTKYYLRAYATNSAGTAYGNELSFSAAAITPGITTTDVTAITTNSAVSGGNITYDGGAAVTNRGVCWSTAPNPNITGTHSENGGGNGVFSSTISNLNPNTKYYVRAYASNSAGISYGNETSFTTNPIVVPVLSTTTVSGITSSGAVTGGEITYDGGAAVTVKGVCWSTNANPTTTNSKTTDGTGTGSFSSNISGLQPGTVYHVRSYAVNSAGTGYGNDITFTSAAVIPVLTTAGATSITINSAVSGGNITFSGGSAVTSRGVCWSTSHNPTIAGAHTSNGSGTGSFVCNVTGLAENTTYYLRAYAINSVGVAYGNEISFLTVQVYPAVLTTAPVTSVSLTGASSGGNISSDGGGIITERGVCWGTSPNPSVSGSHTASGTGSGSFVTNLTSLNEGTLYYIRAYATNSSGTSYGNEVRFSTSVDDMEGNIYRTVLIGTQLWMAEDLKSERYNDNTPISHIPDPDIWKVTTEPAYCWFANAESTYRPLFGALYNWFAVGTGKLCPSGWHVPSHSEFKILEIYLGMSSSDADIFGWRGTDQGAELKYTSTWSAGGNGTNTSGFSALGGGYRYGGDGSYNDLGQVSYWWSSTENSTTDALYRRLDYNTSQVYSQGVRKQGGKFVRCLKNP